MRLIRMPLVVLALITARSSASILFHEDFETDSQMWEATRKATDEGSFQQSYETALAFQGSRVGRVFGSAPPTGSAGFRAVSFTTIGAHIPVSRPVLYFSFWMRVAEGSGPGNFGVGHGEKLKQPGSNYILPRGPTYIFDGYDTEMVNWSWDEFHGEPRQVSYAEARAGWVHVEGAEVELLPESKHFNTSSRIAVNGWSDVPLTSIESTPQPLITDSEVSLQIYTVFGWEGWDLTEVWIDELVVHDDFLVPEAGTIGSAIIEPFLGDHRIRLDGITWPSISGSGFGLKLQLYHPEVHTRRWLWSYDAGDDPHPSTGYFNGDGLVLCDYDWSRASVVWAHVHKDEPGAWHHLPAYASEEVLLNIDVSGCKD